MRRKTKTVMEQMNAEKPDDVLADLESKRGSVQRMVRGSETPRTDSMAASIRAMGEVARARNLAYLCRTLERELRGVGNALDEQNERWGLYGDESKAALRAFKKHNPSNA